MIFQTFQIPQDSIKTRWQEPYISAGLNQKALAGDVRGTVLGFNVQPYSGYQIIIQPDATLGLSVANVIDSSGDKYSLTVVHPTPVFLDLTSQANSTIFVALDAQFSVGSPSGAQVRVVDATELQTNPDLVLLARVDVPVAPPVLASHINMAYRLRLGDSLSPDARPMFNMVLNPSFDADALGGPAQGWTVGGGTTGTVSADFAHSGTQALKLVVAATGTTFTGLVPVIPGQLYRVGLWARSAVGGIAGTGMQVRASFFDSAYAALSTTNTDPPLTGVVTTFTPRKGLVQAPAGAAHARVELSFDNTTTGTVYVDDVEFSSATADAVARTPVFGGAVADHYHTHTASGSLYAGGPTWADGTTNPATTVEAQLDKIISDLKLQTGTGGAGKIGFTPTGNIASNRLDTALAELDTEKAGLGLANVFTALDTFSAGISFPPNQGAAWPNYSIQQISASELNIVNTQAFLSTNALRLQAIPTLQSLMYMDDLGGTTAVFGADSNMTGGVLIGSLSNVPVYITVNNNPYWVVLGQQIQATSPGQISGLALPTLGDDAASKTYVDQLHQYPTLRNNLINGNFEINQRKPSSANLSFNTTASTGYTTGSGRYLMDRWCAQANTTVYNGTVITGEWSQQSVATTRGNFIARVRAAARVGAASPVTTALLGFSQEIDRRFVEALRGRTVGVRVRFRKGSSMTESAHVQLVANNSTPSNENQQVRSYASPTTLIDATVANGGIGANFSSFFFSSLTVPAGAVGLNLLVGRDSTSNVSAFDANDYIEIAEVMLVAMGPGWTTGDIPDDFWLSGGTGPQEMALCEGYYEKSYALFTNPATNTAFGAVYASTAYGNAGLHVAAPSLRRRTRPRYSSAGGVSGGWTIYSKVGTANNVTWENPVQAPIDQAVTLTSSDVGAEVSLGVSQNVGDLVYYHYVSDLDFI